MDYGKLDTPALNELLLNRIRELEQEGLVDCNFRQCHSLKEDSGMSFFSRLIPIFFADLRTVVKKMTEALAQPAVDFGAMDSHCIKLKGSAACIGACRIRDACSRLRQAIDNSHRQGCLQALEEIKFEYTDLHNKLDSIIKIEREIVTRSI